MISRHSLVATRHYRLTLALALLVVSLLLGLEAIKNWEQSKIHGSFTNLSVEEIVIATNQQRADQGVKPLKLDPLLSQAAFRKAEDMMAQGVFDHYYEKGQQTIDPWQFILESGYAYLHAGENLARNFSSSQEVVEAWMNSPTHRDNLLADRYQDVGVAVIESADNKETSVLVVQLLASRVPDELIGVIKPETRPEVVETIVLEKEDSLITPFVSRNYQSLYIIGSLITLLLALVILLDFAKPRMIKPGAPADHMWRN